MAPVIEELKRSTNVKELTVVSTGQHREMLDQSLDLFGIVPDIDLRVLRHGSNLSTSFSALYTAIDEFIQLQQPRWVAVHGDTTTCFAAATAAFYSKVKVAHIEAGLRTYSLSSPYPEEMHRQATDKVSDLLFAPTKVSRDNLLNEGVDPKKIFVTGNTIVDSLKYINSLIEAEDNPLSQTISTMIRSLNFDPYNMKFVLITAHRRENFEIGLVNLCRALRIMSEEVEDTFFVFPVHLNPVVQETVLRELDGLRNVLLLPPLGYIQFLFLLKMCAFVITDSGGIQEEAPSFHKVVLLLRSQTERPEGIALGCTKLIGNSVEEIVDATRQQLQDSQKGGAKKEFANPYGDGFASKRIAQILLDEVRR
jgi:UDP-N-acetylglucosamine 2-epimerase (non-hydrolysing)